jgi:isohexenylglutaconyl-CoA hydratase
MPAAELDTRLDATLKQIRRCAPHANRITKQLVLSVGEQPLESLLDQAARDFAAAVASNEGAEGTMAFVQKRLPNWAE